MIKIRTILAVFSLMALGSGHVMAYQYGYYSPHPYSMPRAYYEPYARASNPYYPYPDYRYQARQPVRSPVISTARIKTHEQPLAEKNTAVPELNRNMDDTAVTSKSAQLSAKKQAFISTLLPYIKQENRRLSVLHNTIATIFSEVEAGTAMGATERQQIKKLAMKYRVKGDPLQEQAARDELLRKIDIIPASLALAQAANESAWGESRFALEANNLFGIWTYDQTKGLKPKNREAGKTHLVRIFDDIGESVRYYMYTLNSHPAYTELRDIRQQLRAAGRDINGFALAAGLEKYSAKGQDYIELIQNMIRQNEWASLDMDNQRA